MKKVNGSVLVASIFVSCTLWFVVSAQNRATNYVQLEVRLEGLDRDKFFVVNSPRTMSVTVRGNPSLVRSIVDENANAVVQLDNPTMGTTAYPVRVLPERLQQLLVDPDPKVSIELEAIESREVPVTVETSGKLTDDRYVLEDLLVSPSKVMVKGPKSQLDENLRVLATINLDTVAANRAIPYPVNLQIQSGSGANAQYAIASPGSVNVTPTFAPAPIEFPAFVSLDFARVRAAEGFEIVGYKINPEQVTVYGTSLNVARVGTVKTAPLMASQIRSTQTLEIPLLPPRGVNVRPRQVQVTIEVKPKSLPDTGTTASPTPNDGNPPDQRN